MYMDANLNTKSLQFVVKHLTMTVTFTLQIQGLLLFIVVVLHGTSATSYQVFPSEYAYKSDSVQKEERSDANCTVYKDAGNISLSDYIHCNGKELLLADFKFGSNEEYKRKYYYQWDNNSQQLLFIFPTRVSLTTITLHYYSDCVRGLPRLIFFAVPDDFDIWDALTTDTSVLNVTDSEVDSVPPGGDPTGCRNVSINVNFSMIYTRKVLMYKYSSTFLLAVSEVQFFNCSSAQAITDAVSTTISDSITQEIGANPVVTTRFSTPDSTISPFTNSCTSMGELKPSSTMTGNDSVIQNKATSSAPVIAMLVGISVAILIVLLVVAVPVFAFLYFRKDKAKSDYDDSYSTLCRGETQQLQPLSQQPPLDTDLYDQIQLSPSIRQSEVASEAEIENILYIPSSQQPRVSPNTDTDQGNKISKQDNVSTSEQPTYVAVKIKQKTPERKEFPKKCMDSSLEKNKEEIVLCSHSAVKVKKRETTPTSVDTTESLEALYSVVQKKPKADRDKEEKIPPPSPPYSVEELYTAVKRNSKGSAMEEEDGAPQIPPHTIEDLYTAVMKKPKGDSTESGTDGAPPISPYTEDDF